MEWWLTVAVVIVSVCTSFGTIFIWLADKKVPKFMGYSSIIILLIFLAIFIGSLFSMDIDAPTNEPPVVEEMRMEPVENVESTEIEETAIAPIESLDTQLPSLRSQMYIQWGDGGVAMLDSWILAVKLVFILVVGFGLFVVGFGMQSTSNKE